MAKSERLRISIDISSDDIFLSCIYDYLVKKGIRKKVLDACGSHYYSLALMDSNAKPDEILDAALSAVHQLHQQIQVIVEQLQRRGIQPTPLMLAKAGITQYSMPAVLPLVALTTPSNQATDDVTESLAIIETDLDEKEDDDDDEWGAIPNLSTVELALKRKSKIELGLVTDG